MNNQLKPNLRKQKACFESKLDLNDNINDNIITLSFFLAFAALLQQ